jgi:competence protein ComEC
VMAVCLVLGVVWADHYSPLPSSVAPFAALALVLMLLATALKFSGGSVFLCLAVALTGASLHAHRIRPGADDVAHLADTDPVRIIATVTRLVSTTEYSQRVQLDVHAAGRKDVAVPVNGKLLCTLPPDRPVSSGQTLLLHDVRISLPVRITSPGQYDEKRMLARRGVHALGKADRFTISRPEPLWRLTLDSTVARIRAHVVQVTRAAMPGPERGLFADLLTGMVFGMYSVELPQDLVEHFRRSGTVHVMVVSGGHVTLVAGAIIFLFRGISMRLPLRVLLIGLPLLLLYGLIAGLYPSVLRSLAMAAILLLGMVTGRRYDVWTALSVAAIALIIADTSAPFSVSVQLTFAAVVGVVAFIPRTGPGRRQRASWFTTTLLPLGGSALGAWLAVTPIMAYHFDSLVLGGILANLIVVPIRALVMGLGIAVVLLGSIWLPLAFLPATAGWVLLEVTVWTVRFFSSLPGSSLSGFHLPLGGIVVWYFAAAVVWWLLYGGSMRQTAESEANRFPRRQSEPEPQPSVSRAWPAVMLFALAAIGFFTAAVAARPAAHLRVIFLSVGQGHCALISDTGGNHVMIDAGSGMASSRAYHWVGPRVILPHLARLRVRHLDALIMTHADDDHCNAMADIIEAMPVRRLFTNGLPLDDSPAAQQALAAANQRGVQSAILRAGAKISLADSAELTVLHPPEKPLQRTVADCNNNSIITRLTYHQISFLFPGDVQREGEEVLLRWARTHGESLRSDVLLLPHHGRKTSSSGPFLDAIRPTVAVVSGAPPNWQPAHPEVVKRTAARGIPLLSTDMQGSIEMRTDGRRLWISSFSGDYPEDRRRRQWQAPTTANDYAAAQ